MNEENEIEEQDIQAVVSEQVEVESLEGEDEQKMVPLSALKATRRKLQEETQRRQQAETSAQVYHEFLLKNKDADSGVNEEEDDPNALVEKQYLQQTTASTKREILETLYQDMNPEAVQKINKYLKPILEKKPWLAASVDSATNRYARAYEIVQDYLHLVEDKHSIGQKSARITDGQRIVQNSQKPRSPVEVGKSAQPGGMDYLKSVQGTKEFREYRKKVLQG